MRLDCFWNWLLDVALRHTVSPSTIAFHELIRQARVDRQGAQEQAAALLARPERLTASARRSISELLLQWQQEAAAGPSQTSSDFARGWTDQAAARVRALHSAGDSAGAAAASLVYFAEAVPLSADSHNALAWLVASADGQGRIHVARAAGYHLLAAYDLRIALEDGDTASLLEDISTSYDWPWQTAVSRLPRDENEGPWERLLLLALQHKTQQGKREHSIYEALRSFYAIRNNQAGLTRAEELQIRDIHPGNTGRPLPSDT